ncbi:MAG: DUF3808 domain-containing protein [Rhizobacter sp.]|nr:DUF3808 domain-containing protein [Chlorobiales bacterium]
MRLIFTLLSFFVFETVLSLSLRTASATALPAAQLGVPVEVPAWRNALSEALVQSGISEIINYNLPLAESKFDSLIALEPDRPEGYFYKSACYFWRYLLGEKQKDYDRFTELSETSVLKSDAFIAAVAENAKAKALGTYFLAEARLEQAFAQGRAKSYISAGINANRSKGLYADALKLDPDFTDAGKGLGLFEFFGTLVPSSVKWLAGMFGYGGDREKGLEMIAAARDKSRYSQTESRYYLAMIQFLFYKNNAAAEKDLLLLSAARPQSTLLNYSIGLFYYQTKQTDKAKLYLTKAAGDALRDAGNAFAAYAMFRLADVDFRLCNFSDAKKNFLLYRTAANFEIYHAQTAYRLGLCYEFSGDRTTAVLYYQQAQAKTENLDELYSQRRAKLLITAPLSQAAKTIYLGRNHFDAGNYAAALLALEPLAEKSMTDAAPDALTDDERAELFYRLARCYDESLAPEKAVKFYQAAFQTPAKQERMFAPFSRFYLAKLYMQQKKYDLALSEFDKASRYVSYDYDKGLQRDLILEQEKLERLRAKP